MTSNAINNSTDRGGGESRVLDSFSFSTHLEGVGDPGQKSRKQGTVEKLESRPVSACTDRRGAGGRDCQAPVGPDVKSSFGGRGVQSKTWSLGEGLLARRSPLRPST